MAYLFKKTKGGEAYWYLGENSRVDGKVKRTWQKYLGTANVINEKFVTGKRPVEIDRLDFGLCASILALNEELCVSKIVDEVIPKRAQGLSVGEHILLTIMNRIHEPHSKRKMSSWFGRTMLKRIFVVKQSYLSSQDFWNHWNMLSEEDLVHIQEKVLENLVKHVDVSELVFDPTNFTTYIEDHEDQNLMQFGHSKDGRKGLRQVNLSLLVTKKEGIPLWHRTYNGNTNDVTEFKEFIQEFTDRITLFSKKSKNITLILDKGNNSLNNIKNISNKLHFFVIGSLKPSEFKEFFEIPLEEFTDEYESNKDAKTFCTSRIIDVYEGKKKVVITYSHELAYNQRVRTQKAIKKAIEQLERLQVRLKHSVRSRDDALLLVNAIAGKNYLSHIITYELTQTKNSLELTFSVDEKAYEEKEKTFGKNLLFTDNLSLTTQEVIALYRDKNIVEEQIKSLKDTHVIRFTPMWCWTDHMIRMHAFTCVLSLLFLRVLTKKVRDAHIMLSDEELLEELNNIQLAIMKMPREEKLVTQLMRINDTQRKLINLLGLRKYI